MSFKDNKNCFVQPDPSGESSHHYYMCDSLIEPVGSNQNTTTHGEYSDF